MVKVLNRRNELVDFDINLVIQAIMKAQGTVNESSFDIALDMSMKIQEEISSMEVIDIDNLLLKVEFKLMESGQYSVAREFISYRAKHDYMREIRVPGKANQVFMTNYTGVVRANEKFYWTTHMGMIDTVPYNTAEEANTAQREHYDNE